ncbi:MAG: hypothetical protein KC592_11840 [Nitrospira sp.]|nr:hypothetical protein [Nitrospira sp.]
MPGVYGCFGCSSEEESHLQKEFSKPWGKCEQLKFRGGIIGGHAFPKKTALHNIKENIIFALDGEIAIYRMAEKFTTINCKELFDISSGILNEGKFLKGNMVVVDKALGLCQIVSEWTGTFPLYYAQINQKFFFCSRQKPIAQVLGLSPDYIGILEYFRNDYMYAGRTFFNGLRRLLPGQTLSFNQLTGDLKVKESSRFWAPGENKINSDNFVEVFRDKLEDSLNRCFGSDLHIALMMSGGWDSRLLLGGLLHLINPAKVEAYVYGDIRSREIKLVKKICQSAKVNCFVDNYGPEILNTTLLQEGFNRSELIRFPYWYHAGRRLANEGVDCVTAGVYGEVLGGHYGSTMWLSGWRKIFSVGSQMLKKSISSVDIKRHFRLNGLKQPYYLKSTLWNNIGNLTHAMNEDLENSVQRLIDRGITSPEILIEAFIAEHRGSQYINSQILSCRASLDISLPFCDNDLLDISGQIPMIEKTQNILTCELLRGIAPDLLHYPTVATLVPAYFPMIFQEASRAFRVLLEDAQYYLTRATAGRIKAPSWSWLNNEILRSNPALKVMLEDLRCGFWEREALSNAIKTPEKFEGGLYTLNNLLSRFLKIYSVDLMLR